MWWAMVPLLFVIPSSRFISLQSKVHGTEDGLSQFYPNGRHRLCMGHLQQGFMVLSARVTVFRVCPLSFTAIVMTLPTLSPLLQWDSMTMLTHYDGWNLAGNSASVPFQKVNHHCPGIVTGASGLTITYASNFLDWYMHSNIQSCIGECGANLTSYESRAN